MVIFLLAIIVWYSPIVFKGYPIQTVSEDMLLARNYHETGIFASQNNQDVTISSSLIKQEGRPLVMSQHLRSFFYAKIFDVFGILDYNSLILISIILYALVLVLFTILTLYLFDFKIAVVFALIYIFSPIGWGLATSYLGLYEFCLIFLALFFIFYFVGVKKTRQSQKKFNNLFFVLSGIFLAFSSLSKEVVLVFALAFFIFLLIKKLRYQLVYIFIPFVVLLMIFWLPSVLSGKNPYLSFASREAERPSSSAYLHVFPDPYTYHFEKEEFLEEYRNQNLGLSEDLKTRKFLTDMGFEKVGFFARFKVGGYILIQHLSRFFSLEDFGGPFVVLLLALGLVYLRRKYRFLYELSLYWLIISLFVFSFILLVSRNHLMDFIWPLILLVVLGLFYLFQIIKDHFKLGERKIAFFGIIVIGLILYHLVLVNHVVLGRQYDKDFIPRSMAYAKKIEKLEIRDLDVIAIPGDFPRQSTTLNYLTDKSFIIFRNSTLNKLVEEEKTGQALEYFKIKYILGYSDELSDKITSQTEVINIAPDSLEVDIGEISKDKSFFMNLVK